MTSYTRAIIVNSPNNPSGAIYPPELIQKIVDFCERKGIYMICDDIYHKLVFDGINFKSRIWLNGNALDQLGAVASSDEKVGRQWPRNLAQGSGAPFFGQLARQGVGDAAQNHGRGGHLYRVFLALVVEQGQQPGGGRAVVGMEMPFRRQCVGGFSPARGIFRVQLERFAHAIEVPRR